MSNTKFINSLFLKNLIESQYGEKDVKIKSYSVEDASENTSGINTRSSINRLLVKYSSRMVDEDVVTFVTKIKPTKSGLAEEYKISDDFVKEIAVYKTVLPGLATVLKKIDEKVEFTPKWVITNLFLQLVLNVINLKIIA